jgi:hypothetical protein
MPNPYTTTRAAFTEAICSKPPPPLASPAYQTLNTALRNLVTALAAHPAMAPNLPQTYMTPAAQKSKIYFMWDFTGRTLGMLNGIEGAAAATLGMRGKGKGKGMARKMEEVWDDVVGRAQFGSVLISDTSGKIEMMCGGDTTAFGDEVARAAAAVTEAVEG